ncbi:MAG TPA: hypothetical protein VLC09_02040 [Polyangiaceae bacterium]|nr:hypothetical protein [Polyangiaceae bacterium]
MFGSARSYLLASGVLLFSVGCGGGGGDARSADDTQGAAAVAPAPAAKPLPPLEKAPAPRSLVVKARARDVTKLLDGSLEAAGIPMTAADGLDELLREGWPRSVELSLPIEALVSLRPEGHKEPFAAVSFGVRDLPSLVRDLAARGIDAREGPAGNYYFGYEGQPCAAGRALGPSPARVVCAGDADGLSELLPYALTGLPAEALSDADLHVDVDLRPVRLAYGRQLRALRLLASVGARQLHIDEPRFDRAISDMAVALADEIAFLSDDTDEISARIYEDRGDFHGNVVVRFHGGASWTEQTLDGWAKRSGPAPAIFDAIPATAASASYSQPWAEDKLLGPRSTLIDLAVGYAASEKWSKPLQSRLEKVLLGLFHLEKDATVQATGPVVRVTDEGEPRLAPAWQIWGSSRSETQVRTLFSDLQALFDSAEFRKWAGEPKWQPKFKRRPAGLPGMPKAVVYEWELPLALRELGSTLADLDQKRNLEELRELSAVNPWKSYDKGYLAVTTIDGRTWVAMGGQLEQLAEPLRALGNSSTARLSSETDPEVVTMRQRSSVAAAYLRLPALVSYFAAYLPATFTTRYAELVEGLPSRGQVPVTTWFQVRRDTGTELEYAWRVPKGFVTDLAVLTALAVGDSWKGSASHGDKHDKPNKHH